MRKIVNLSRREDRLEELQTLCSEQFHDMIHDGVHLLRQKRMKNGDHFTDHTPAVDTIFEQGFRNSLGAAREFWKYVSAPEENITTSGAKYRA
jgi:hypothetical protein